MTPRKQVWIKNIKTFIGMIRYQEKTACLSRAIAASSFLGSAALLLFRAITVQQIKQSTQTNQKQPICTDKFAVLARGASRVWPTLRVSSFGHRAEPAPHASASARGHPTNKSADCFIKMKDSDLRPFIEWQSKPGQTIDYCSLHAGCVVQSWKAFHLTKKYICLNSLLPIRLQFRKMPDPSPDSSY